MKRKQAAVVFNDIQGYTSLMQENESYAVVLRQRHKEVVDRLTHIYKGTIIQYYGDGTLSIFDHALDAVQCALSMQKEFLQTPRIPLRIGINAGDVLLGPDGIYGDSVNIASRIERMSVPGSVLISQKVFEQIQNGGIETKALGQFELKNVRHPVVLHAVVAEGITVPDPVELAGKIGHKDKSLMVLPFFNLSKDPENDAMCDEITEQVISALSMIDGLRLTSRTSSFTYKDKQVNLRQLHQELGIDHILEGSIRRHGNKIRITAQLIHAANDFHLWSETYHREISDAFHVQDEIATMISNKLKASFLQSGFRKDAREEDPGTDSVAQTLYHKGRFFWKQMHTGFIDKSIEHFREAVEADPAFYPAWPSLATAYAYKGYSNMIPSSKAAALCLECLHQMDALQPDHTRSHFAWGLHHLFHTWHWDFAADRLTKAAALQENDNFIFSTTILHASGIYLLATGRVHEAILILRKALKTDPLNVGIHFELARALSYHRDFSKASESIDSVIRSRPDHIPAYELKGWIHFSSGQQREGIECFEFCRDNGSLPSSGLSGLAYALARMSQPSASAKVLDLLTTVYQDMPMHLPHYDLAIAHLGAQQYQEMFNQLSFAVSEKMPQMLFLEVNPVWDEIKRFKEYKPLIARINGSHQRPPL